MPRAAVLGSPIEHSLSPVLHNAGYQALGLEDWSYTRFECEAAQLPELVDRAEEDFVGFSVTMPGKFAALKHGTEVTDRARLMGSANTLVRLENGWRADNTDTEGVAGALEELLGDRSIDRAMVIGSGGTARPAICALGQRGVTHIDLLNRRDRRAELSNLTGTLGIHVEPATYRDNLKALARKADVIISTVPSAALDGFEEDLAQAPVLDVIYDPWPTRLITAAAADGYRTVGGHVMLACQAFSQFEQFTGHEAPRAEMFDALRDALGRTR